MPFETQIRHLDEEKDQMLYKFKALRGLDFLLYQEMMEEEEEKAAEKSAGK